MIPVTDTDQLNNVDWINYYDGSSGLVTVIALKLTMILFTNDDFLGGFYTLHGMECCHRNNRFSI